MNGITDVDTLRKEASRIQDFLSNLPTDQIEDVLRYGNQLSAIIARTGKMYADALYHKNRLLQSAVFKAMEKQAKELLPASVLKQYIEAACKDYTHTLTWIERLNKTATHQLDWCRTMVSNAKSERDSSKGIRQ